MAETPDTDVETDRAGLAVDVAVLDNDSMALERLVTVLPRLLPGLHVAWSTCSAPEAIRRCLDDGWRPRMLVVDVELDHATGMDVCRRIREVDSEPLLLAMTSYNPKTYASALAASGAQGLMVKGNMAQMAVALRRVVAGQTFSPVANVDFPTAGEAYRRLCAGSAASGSMVNAIGGSLAADGDSLASQRQAAQGDPTLSLSALEQRILTSVAEGYSNEEIAAALSITTATVRSHTRNIREKLSAKTLSHAVAIWLTRRQV